MPPISEATRRLWLGRILGYAGTAAVVGITLSVQELFSAWMDAGLNPASIPWRTAVICAASICGWGLIVRIGRRWRKHGEYPPTWAVLAVVGLGWVAILVNHLPA